MKTVVLWFCLVLLIAIGFGEDAFSVGYPHMLNIQGSLMDSGGNPVADGSYDVTFSIYDVETGGTVLWSETVSVDVVNGLFSTLLGSVTTLPDTLFSNHPLLWLGMKVGTDPEMTPRQQLVAMPYSYISYNTTNSGAGWIDDSNVVRLSNIYDSVGVGTSTPSAKLEVVGDTKIQQDLTLGDSSHTAILQVYRANVTGPVSELSSSIHGGIVHTFDEASNVTAAIEADVGGEGGFFYVSRSAGATGFYVDGNYAGLQEPFVSILGSSQSVYFNLSSTGDNVVNLPDNSINAAEISNEPGIVHYTYNSAYTLSTTEMTTVGSVTLTAPTSGYVFVQGRGSVQFVDPTGLKLAWLQIDTTSGGGIIGSNYTLCRIEEFPSSGAYLYNMTTQRVFFVSAGTYTFIMEGETNENGTARIYVPQMTAMFFPTAYGTVSNIVNSSDATQFKNAVPLPIEEGTGEQLYQVDLRELEMKAKQLREELQQVEQEMIKAELQKQLDFVSSNR